MNKKRRFSVSLNMMRERILKRKIYDKLYIIIENFINCHGMNATMTSYFDNEDCTFNVNLMTEIYDQDSCKEIWEYTSEDFANIINLCMKEYDVPFSKIIIKNVKKSEEIVRWIDEVNLSKVIQIHYLVEGVHELCKPFFI